MRLTGNKVLITGGTSGIGLAFAEEFIKEGSEVIITGRRADRLEEIEKRLPGIITKVSDVADTAQRTQLADWIQQHHPDTNILINNAGVQLTTDFTKPINLERLRMETETNFIAPVHLGSLFVSILGKNENAAIMNVTSGLAFVPIAFMPVYCATKAAMHSVTIALRHQLRKTAIKVFEIIPPSVDTELGHDRREDKSQSHGGMPVSEFIVGAMAAIKNDELEAAIGHASSLRQKREEIFGQMNAQFD